MNTLVGTSVPRKDGNAKVCGTAMYIDDLQFPGVLYGATVRSQVPRGRIIAVNFGSGIPWEQFTVVTATDIPGQNCISLITDDQPCLAATHVNHPEEPIVLLAHPDRYLLEEARRAVQIEIEPLPAVLTMEESLDGKIVIWGKDNIFKRIVIEKGDIDTVWGHADFIVEEEYSTGAQEQLYIEPNGMVAVASPQAGVTVWGSMQCPYYVHKALTKLFGIGEDYVRVIQTETGGGFGGKEEYPSMIAAHAALLAWKSGKAVKLIYDRAEDMAATTKRHPARIHHRTAVRRDGKLLGMDINFRIDGGAYATLTPVVLSRGSIHAAGPYECPNIRVCGQAVATNTVPHGAFRGFGAPQAFFALERHMNKVAAVLGLPPSEIRRRNFLRKGSITATGQEIRENIDLSGLLDRALAESGYHMKQARFSRENPQSAIKRGIGLSAFCHGAGFTGSGERYLQSTAGVEATSTGQVRILTSGVEIGQGTNTSLAQIVAETLMLPFHQVDVVQPDTAFVPNSGPTVASRTCMVIGKLLERAACDLRQILQSSGFLSSRYSVSEFRAACAAFIQQHGELKAYAQYEAPPGIAWNDEKHSGDAYGTFSWAVHVAEVSVDPATCEVQVEDFVTVQEVGHVIHPLLAAGQIEGGVAQGIGYALHENVVWSKGRMENCQMTNYCIPTSLDVPRIRVIFVEDAYPHGPMGAKGIGELPIDGPAPAVLNAVEDAIGLSMTRIPATPESLMVAMEAMYAKNTRAIAS
ncbi:MAG: xanthine dehydrogenase family protein molybdopterin-binding subunit [Candidatus Angelobacter sp.]